MKLTINTDVLRKYNLNLKEFLVLLIGYYDLGYKEELEALTKRGLVEKNLFSELPPILSDNTKNLVARIMVESDDKVVNCGIDFEELADAMRKCYPEGVKTGTTYNWQGTKEEIVQKLMTLVTKYNFIFTEEEAIRAVMEYVHSFKDYKFMHLLRNFILTIKRDETGHCEMESMFMTIIENNREADEIDS